MSGLSALIDFAAPGGELAPIRLAFGAPDAVVVADTPSEVLKLLNTVEDAARRGCWCVGYLRYEAASAFDPKAPTHAADGPLAFFSIHERPMAFPDLGKDIDRAIPWRADVDRQKFDASVARIHDAIKGGDVYQVNYTGRLGAEYSGNAFDLFCALKRSQPHSNAAFIAGAGEHVLSVSPELFFDWDGTTVTCAPMKGTAPRDADVDIDARNAAQLRDSGKERAENVMIVDLMRNDLSRIAELGSVHVPRLFECHAWPTVWQLVSRVTARTRPHTTLAEIFRALFPCGSVTGAPKLRAMHWITNLESSPRGVYCGAVGVVQPGGAARFNVPIRTVTLRRGKATCGIGSGITWSSVAQNEWEEWRHKAIFLDQSSRPFQLLQTLRLESGHCQHLEFHLDRLEAAAAHFGFLFDRDLVRRDLAKTVHRASVRQARVRIRVDHRGATQLEVHALPSASDAIPSVRLADRPIHAPPAFLRHKTTRREHYEQFDAAGAGFFDCLLWNSQGEVTEFTRGSVVIERADGRRVTPPLRSGLLDGVGRALALASGEAIEDVIAIDELANARRLWFVNALRGSIEVRLDKSHGLDLVSNPAFTVAVDQPWTGPFHLPCKTAL